MTDFCVVWISHFIFSGKILVSTFTVASEHSSKPPSWNQPSGQPVQFMDCPRTRRRVEPTQFWQSSELPLKYVPGPHVTQLSALRRLVEPKVHFVQSSCKLALANALLLVHVPAGQSEQESARRRLVVPVHLLQPSAITCPAGQYHSHWWSEVAPLDSHTYKLAFAPLPVPGDPQISMQYFDASTENLFPAF